MLDSICGFSAPPAQLWSAASAPSGTSPTWCSGGSDWALLTPISMKHIYDRIPSGYDDTKTRKQSVSCGNQARGTTSQPCNIVEDVRFDRLAVKVSLRHQFIWPHREARLHWRQQSDVTGRVAPLKPQDPTRPFLVCCLFLVYPRIVRPPILAMPIFSASLSQPSPSLNP